MSGHFVGRVKTSLRHTHISACVNAHQLATCIRLIRWSWCFSQPKETLNFTNENHKRIVNNGGKRLCRGNERSGFIVTSPYWNSTVGMRIDMICTHDFFFFFFWWPANLKHSETFSCYLFVFNTSTHSYFIFIFAFPFKIQLTFFSNFNGYSYILFDIIFPLRCRHF